MTTALFYVFGATALAAALLAVTRKNAVASAIWLIVMFFGLAANYVLMEAWFVAVVQVLVYAGAIMVLFLFVIMMLHGPTLEAEQVRAVPRAWPVLVLPPVVIGGATVISASTWLILVVTTLSLIASATPAAMAGGRGAEKIYVLAVILR